MAASADHANLIDQARHLFADVFLRDLQAMLDAVTEGAHGLAEQPAERALAQKRADVVQGLHRNGSAWLPNLSDLVHAQVTPLDELDSKSSALVAKMQAPKDLTLVDDATIQREIVISRIALAILDRASWELTDLRARVMQYSQQPDLADDDLFRPQSLARCLIDAWLAAGLSADAWQAMEPVLHKAVARRAEEAYHEANRWLVEHGVMPEVDLRTFIRRTDGSSTQSATLDEGGVESTPAALPRGGSEEAAPPAWRRLFSDAASDPQSLSRPGESTGGGRPGAAGGGGQVGGGWPGSGGGAGRADSRGASSGSGGGGGGGGGGSPGSGTAGEPVGGQAGAAWSTRAGGITGYQRGYDEETRLLTRPARHAPMSADVVLEQFGDIMDRHLPGFRDTGQARPASEKLSQAMARAQQQLVAQVEASEAPAADGGTAAEISPAQVLRDLRERQQALKQAASTPAERATIELVALLFQSILSDERVPATVRVWFARLQMPTLRVAVAEPDFFSSEDHPARRLIDRMGACVMGFEGHVEMVGAPLEAEIKRIVQVVEAFPDTGRRVFQTVLNEFEKFLEKYYADQSDTTRMGISLAQQVEQRETLAIQFTIELRKLLNDVPVQDGVRDFLFHIWADVLATTAVRHGAQSAEVRAVREAATELLWTASAKTTREERAEVIRRLPPLLATLRQGMGTAGMTPKHQQEAIQALNLALTAAFGARSSTVSDEQLESLKRRLETIEELIPDDDFEIDDTWVLDEASHSQDGLEVVSDGGSMPGPAMLAWAAELRLGDAFTLEYRGRHDVVRLVWQGMHKQLSLFNTSGGRCVLFQKARLAAFLQAGLLLPVQDEALTVTATRDAMRKIEADPSRLLH